MHLVSRPPLTMTILLQGEKIGNLSVVFSAFSKQKDSSGTESQLNTFRLLAGWQSRGSVDRRILKKIVLIFHMLPYK